MNSIGMINLAGYHSASVILLRSVEDALDCFSSVAQEENAAQKWLDRQLTASQAAKIWEADKMIDNSIPLGEYRKSIDLGLNDYCHCALYQINWNLYRKALLGKQNTCTVELNYTRLVINTNGYYIDGYLCVHLFELITVIQMHFSKYLLGNSKTDEKLRILKEGIKKIVTDFYKI